MRRYRLAILLILTGISISVALASWPQPPASIEAAIAATLHTRNIAADQVLVTDAHCVPAHETCLSYIADVEIRGYDAIGRLACKQPWDGCTLWMAELGADHAPVARVVPHHPLLVQLSKQLRGIADWLRTTGKRSMP